MKNDLHILLFREVRAESWEYLGYGPKQRLHHIFKFLSQVYIDHASIVFIGINLRSLRYCWDVCFSNLTKDKHIITFPILTRSIALVCRNLQGSKQTYLFEIPVLILSKWMTTDFEINRFARQTVSSVFSI